MPLPHSLGAARPRPVRSVDVFARAKLPSRHGEFTIVSFTDERGRTLDDVAIVRGDVAGVDAVPTRVHSECLTGDVFGSKRCDCRDQLELALERFADADVAIILYMRQEGRGIGIAHKVRAYALQEQGLDTVEANLHLGFDSDLRDYGTAAAMLRALGVGSVALHTNNLEKIAGLQQHGVPVAERVAIQSDPGEHNERYLATKREKCGHLLD
ncbi:MAG: GTP cyclohydrolase II [Myxococcales bacterium]|nr:GTP cyclohydrolase II [Myxococcales bacterium]